MANPYIVHAPGRFTEKVQSPQKAEASTKTLYTHLTHDIRFTTQGDVLYALALGTPVSQQITIRSLAKPDGANVNRIDHIELLGSDAPINWKQTEHGLTVNLNTKPTV